MVDLNLQHMGVYHLNKGERGMHNDRVDQHLHQGMEEQVSVKTRAATEILVMEAI